MADLPRGFAAVPTPRLAGTEGVLVYRCWGASSREWGRYFSLEKPSSVLDAELRYNIADWGNGIHFVSTFRIMPGVRYLEGPIDHDSLDLRRTGTQIFIDGPLHPKLQLVRSKEILAHDVWVASRTGHA